MKFETHIDIRHRQQFEQFLQKSKQINRNEKNVLTNIEKIRKNMKFEIHIDIRHRQQFEHSLQN